MANIDELKKQADIIKNEKEKGANTAIRVGGLFESIVDFFTTKADKNVGDTSVVYAKQNLPKNRDILIYEGSEMVNRPIDNYMNARVFDGGTPSSLYGGSRTIDCGGVTD